MLKQNSEQILKDLLKDWAEGKINSFSAMIVVGILVNNIPSKEAIAWAENIVKKDKQNVKD